MSRGSSPELGDGVAGADAMGGGDWGSDGSPSNDDGDDARSDAGSEASASTSTSSSASIAEQQDLCLGFDSDGEEAGDGDICGAKLDALAAAFAGDAFGTSEPTPEETVGKKRKKRKKPKDPVVAAQRRVWQRQRKEAKAAQRARKRELRRQNKRRGTGQDLEAFLVRTTERLKLKAVEAQAEAARAAVAANVPEGPPRGAGSDVQTFLRRTRGRVADRSALADAAAEAHKAARVAEEAAAEASAKLDDFRRKTEARLAQRVQPALASGGLVGGRPRRIAIVGAGPVGLWLGVLLAQKHRTADALGNYAKWADAPEVVIFEGRAQSEHCTRTDIRISLSPATCNLLNTRAKSHHFCTGMPVAEIESRLLKRLRRVDQRAAPVFGRPISDPAQLVSEGFDCILWAGGRRSLDDGVRNRMSAGLKLSESARVLVFQFKDLEAGGSIHSDLAHAACQASKWSSFKVLLRPGVTGLCDGWLWLFGLPPDAAAVRAAADLGPASTFQEAVSRIVDESSPGADMLLAAAEIFQQRIRSAECTARWVDAAFWSSDRSACELGSGDGPGVPVVLLGDALCGKPFYTGTTLNSHLKYVAAMVDEVNWLHNGAPMGRASFASHERRYQEEIRRVPQFERRGAAAPTSPQSGTATGCQEVEDGAQDRECGPPSSPPPLRRGSPPAPTEKPPSPESQLRAQFGSVSVAAKAFTRLQPLVLPSACGVSATSMADCGRLGAAAGGVAA